MSKLKSKIHIKEKNKGLFTKYCNGKVTQACIDRGKNSSDPAVRKRATFADNSRKWKHLFGGTILSVTPSLEESEYDRYRSMNPAQRRNILLEKARLQLSTPTFSNLLGAAGNMLLYGWSYVPIFGDNAGTPDNPYIQGGTAPLPSFSGTPMIDTRNLSTTYKHFKNLGQVVSRGKGIQVPQGMSGAEIESVLSAARKNPALTAAEKAAQDDFATMTGLSVPKSGRGRPSFTGKIGESTYDVRYSLPSSVTHKVVLPVKVAEPVEPVKVVEPPKIEVVAEKQTLTPRDAKKAYARKRAEDKAEGVRLSRSTEATFKGYKAQSTGDDRSVNPGRPRTKATRDVIRGYLAGSYSNTSFGKRWLATFKLEAKKGYETPTIKANRLLIMKEFADAYGYYFK